MTAYSTWRVSKSEPIAEAGMVTAKHKLAVDAGLDVLRRGGNAIDAAVTAALAMGVVDPGANGIGGGGMMVVYLADRQRTVTIDFAMDCPLAADATAYQLEAGAGGNRFGWRKVRDDANAVGYRSAAVPGTVRGLALALEQFGTISWADALAPAIRFAEEGFEVPWNLALGISMAMPVLAPYPATAEIFLPGGVPPRPPDGNRAGDLLVQRDLARTLRTLAEEGPDAYYRGSIARTIGQEMARLDGLITADDLARYQPTITEGGISTDYRGYTVYGVPGACGCVTALQGLNMLECFDLAAAPPDALETVHLHAETYRRTFADRYRYLGDPKQSRVPWDGLLSKAYAAQRAAEIDLTRAANPLSAGDPWAFDSARVPAGVAGRASGAADTSTTHVNAIDRDRNMVSLTQTLVNGFGSGAVVPGTGILLNNAMLWVDPEPGRPNSIGPGKRGLNNMTPLLVLRDGQPVMALGAPGGARIINALTQILSYVVDHGLPMQAAMEVPRIDCATPRVIVDSRLPDSVQSGLAELGHMTRVVDETFGTVNFSTPLAILVNADDGTLHGGVDPFRTAIAGGFS
ncbi:MAG: gamma-glutamyltransferase [Chloroflexi bacterium]|nr:gamma-glutamyltransferase [Chloroflexota bacterium]